MEVMRVLIGHLDHPLPAYDRNRFEIEVAGYAPDGVGPPATIREMLTRCPDGWRPDVYYHAGLVHFPIPSDIETFDGLTACHIQDWHRGGRALWAGVGFFDLVATERIACTLLEAQGYKGAHFCRFWGVDPELHRLQREVKRDIDVLFIGSLNDAIWAERNRWLDRLAKLSNRYRVLIAMGHYGEDYVALTNRAKIVFNRSVNGCTNQRAYDAPACGALVFNETENDECRETFIENEHCVYYSADDFEAKLDFYLTHAAERDRIAEAGRRFVLERHTESVHFNDLLELLNENLSQSGYRPAASLVEQDRARRKAMQIYCSTRPAYADQGLELLEVAERLGLEPWQVREARTALLGWQARHRFGHEKVKQLGVAIDQARRAVRAEPRHVLGHLALGLLLVERAQETGGAHPTGRNDIAEAALALTTAAERCESAGTQAVAGETGDIEGFVSPRWNDLFDAWIERAYLLRGVNEAEWAALMRSAIAWRCRSLLADLASANDQRDEARAQAAKAAAALPEEASGLLRLARYEAMVGHLSAALEQYAGGLNGTPLACEAWPELVAVLCALKQNGTAREYAGERLRVLDAIPALAAIRPALATALADGEPEERKDGSTDE